MEIQMGMKPKHYFLNPTQKKKAENTIKEFLSSLEEVGFAFLFGSFSDESWPSSLPIHDIDVGIFLRNPDKHASYYYGLELSEQLTTLVGVPVDIRVMNFAPVTFLFHVVRGQLIIDKDEDTRCAFMESVVRRYLDMKPLLHRAIKEAYEYENES